MYPRFLALILSILLATIATPAHADCDPPLTGSPCGPGGIASMSGAEPSLNLGAGNPIHIATGNKYQQETDLPANPHFPGLQLVRHYNSLDPRTSTTGRGWALSYDTRLYRVASGWQVLQADGSRVHFSDRNVSDDGDHHNQYGRLDHVNQHHNWFWPSGVILRFNQRGLLVSIRSLSGELTLIERHPPQHPYAGHMHRVVNEREQVMTFHYQMHDRQPLLHHVDTPMGRFLYSHDDQLRLTRMTRPDAMERLYLYEPARQAGHAHALTGIVIKDTHTSQYKRLNTWAYDQQGRAIQSIAGGPSSLHQRIDITYAKPPGRRDQGLTLVDTPNARQTRFYTQIIASRHVLTRVSGAGCPGCARPGTRASYDHAARLISVNGTRIDRNRDGAIHRLRPHQSGWPGLLFTYDADGYRTSWQSTQTGKERIRYNNRGLPTLRQFANGDRVAIDYNVHDRPEVLQETHDGKHSTTRLAWYGTQLTGITHPRESEQRTYDQRGHLASRQVTRHCRATVLCPKYSETFLYDAMDRLVQHTLPEGGKLHYEWGRKKQLTGIVWEDHHGARHRIIRALPNTAGYQYGNGLHLDSLADKKQRVRWLRLTNDTHSLLEQYLEYDKQQRIRAELIDAHVPNTTTPLTQQWRYARNQAGQLIGSAMVSGSGTKADTRKDIWTAWGPGGQARAWSNVGSTFRPVVQRDPSGLARHADGYDLTYNAARRLATVKQNGKRLASYRHNAFGHRISRRGANGHKTDYYYVGNRLVAETRHNLIQPGSKPRGTDSSLPVTRRYVYAHHVPVAVIDYDPSTGKQRLYYVHADLAGLPRLATDTHQTIRWQADYTPFGEATTIRGDLTLELRYPGQLHDPATGWHDNLLRTYQPRWGHYLEPDPLGPVPGHQAFGYAAQRPRQHADPTGLLLFAFDGTRQSPATQGNVWKMSQYYLDGPVHYHDGPGNSYRLDWDAITATRAGRIINTQWDRLLTELASADPHDTIPIDILGFSRGAALARHFGNLVTRHVDQGMFEANDPAHGHVSACVDLRFMGLFDSVAQFGVAGSQNYMYDLDVSAAWEWIAHAVALHEHRWDFPLLPARGDVQGQIIEAPFIGAHSDIGGGVLPAERDKGLRHGDLANVALNWMLWQAHAASVQFAQPDQADLVINEPILHDYRLKLLNRPQGGDRPLQSPDGKHVLSYQGDDPLLGKKPRTETEAYIRRPDGWPRLSGPQAGEVDLDGYAQWLHDELGWQSPPL